MGRGGEGDCGQLSVNAKPKAPMAKSDLAAELVGEEGQIHPG